MTIIDVLKSNQVLKRATRKGEGDYFDRCSVVMNRSRNVVCDAHVVAAIDMVWSEYSGRENELIKRRVRKRKQKEGIREQTIQKNILTEKCDAPKQMKGRKDMPNEDTSEETEDVGYS